MICRALSYVVCVATAVLLAGCLPLPIPPHPLATRRNIGPNLPNPIVAGKTTMEEVLLALGEPDFTYTTAGWTRMVWTAGRSQGGLGGMIFASNFGIMMVNQAMEYRRLVVSFDPRGLVLSSDYEQRSCLEVAFWAGKDEEWHPCVGRNWLKGN